jgi:hypothetical protein
LPLVLKELKEDYYILEIENHRLMRYYNHYFDTMDNKMLNWHINGKLNRYKVRKRKYLVTGETYLEIKKKNNKGITRKVRIPTSNDMEEEENFVSNHTPFDFKELQKTIEIRFDRFMFIRKDRLYRISIDFNVEFSQGGRSVKMENLVLFEIKSPGRLGYFPLKSSLKAIQIFPNGFSKYVIGMSYMQRDLKMNRFKLRKNKINRIIQNELL